MHRRMSERIAVRPCPCDTKPCEYCQASGVIKGVFSAMECEACDGLGFTTAHGHWLDSHLTHHIRDYQRRQREKKAVECENHKKMHVPAQLAVKGWIKDKDGRLYKPNDQHTVLD